MAATDELKLEYNKLLQCALRELTQTNLVIDGIIGTKTLQCFRRFGESLGYTYDQDPQVIDGPLGEAVYTLGAARYATAQDYTELAKRLKVPESYVRAVAEVETRDHAFLVTGKTTILFERHKFDSLLSKALKKQHVLARLLKQLAIEGNAQDVLALIRKRHPNICSSTAGGYLGGAKEWERLELARSFDQDAAFESASWGRFQIMGFNHKLAGYPSAVAMALDYEHSEKNQLKSLATFIENQPNMHSALKRRDFAEFAKLFNGPAYKNNQYDTRMDSAEKRWAKILAA